MNADKEEVVALLKFASPGKTLKSKHCQSIDFLLKIDTIFKYGDNHSPY
jgi:hypothetical protein